MSQGPETEGYAKHQVYRRIIDGDIDFLSTVAKLSDDIVGRTISGSYQHTVLYDDEELGPRLTCDEEVIDEPIVDVYPAKKFHMVLMFRGSASAIRHRFNFAGASSSLEANRALKLRQADESIRELGFDPNRTPILCDGLKQSFTPGVGTEYSLLPQFENLGNVALLTQITKLYELMSLGRDSKKAAQLSFPMDPHAPFLQIPENVDPEKRTELAAAIKDLLAKPLRFVLGPVRSDT